MAVFVVSVYNYISVNDSGHPSKSVNKLYGMGASKQTPKQLWVCKINVKTMEDSSGRSANITCFISFLTSC